MLYVYRFLWLLRTWGGCWFVVYIWRFIYNFLNMCPFDYTAVVGSGKVGPVNQVNPTSWVTVVTPTDRPKSVRNRCVIELFCDVVCVVALPFWHFCWCIGFCHRTESDLFLFLLHSHGIRLQWSIWKLWQIFSIERHWSRDGIIETDFFFDF